MERVYVPCLMVLFFLLLYNRVRGRTLHASARLRLRSVACLRRNHHTVLKMRSDILSRCEYKLQVNNK